MEIRLKANNTPENLILKYLTENASETLAEKINKGTKTLADAMAYIRDCAREYAKNGVACIEDSTVFGWAIHYFEEDELKPAIKKAAAPEPKEEPKNNIVKIEPRKEKTIKVAAQLDGQTSLFDFMG